MSDVVITLQQCGEKLSKEELLAALAEECTELAHAALKYRRVLVQENYTPLTKKESIAAVQEELSDVMNILVGGGFVDPRSTVASMCSKDKADRWERRLNKKLNTEDKTQRIPRANSGEDFEAFWKMLHDIFLQRYR